MNITSRAAPKPTFDAIELVIRIESLREMQALQKMCEGRSYTASEIDLVVRFKRELLPHVTAL